MCRRRIRGVVKEHFLPSRNDETTCRSSIVTVSARHFTRITDIPEPYGFQLQPKPEPHGMIKKFKKKQVFFFRDFWHVCLLCVRLLQYRSRVQVPEYTQQYCILVVYCHRYILVRITVWGLGSGGGTVETCLRHQHTTTIVHHVNVKHHDVWASVKK
jgi:hypothetical protein